MTVLAAPPEHRAPAAPKAKRRKQRFPPVLLWFVLLPFAVEAFWVFWPALQGFYLSLTHWDGVSPPTWAGFGNYTELLSDPTFGTAFANTAIWLVLFGGVSAAGGLGLALLLQQERRGIGFYRAAMFTPVVFSLVATSLIWQGLYQPDGLVNSSLDLVGLGDWQRAWLADPDTALYAILLPALWRQLGYVMVLYLAGLKGIDPALYEAAQLDGASPWQRFRHVTWPQLRSVNSVILSVIVIDSLRSFDVVWSMTKGGPYHSSELLSTYMYSTAFQTLRLGYASALAVVIFLLAFGVIVTYLVRVLREDAS
ncbi:multiple sugar transport system permease protein/raffinose/stachyose/melibiose transport system permease protein [Crossiella equi]|uniref:Multiple sugar transport system permease protein/raffinose/stachyose/melibiose transport system permease protein n=1 Tax=Crossiella equi TaxID=130796 RepID=A0ABS5A862_9PSEU|nr:sugar ABC transporter permease [Crossiella equi]MBP2472442.1 multiple sugar transport system permease protein/raffinose/stachyose/melibiose transport system permease protein [Crossiella equi]